MAEEKELTVQEAKDLFSIQIVLNNLLDKYKEVLDSQTSLQSLVEELTKKNEDLTIKVSQLLEQVSANDLLTKENAKLREDNIKIVKKLKEKSPSEETESVEESPKEKKTKTTTKAEKDAKREAAIKVIDQCKRMKRTILRENDVAGILKCKQEEAKVIYGYLRDRAIVDKTLTIHYEKKI